MLKLKTKKKFRKLKTNCLNNSNECQMLPSSREKVSTIGKRLYRCTLFVMLLYAYSKQIQHTLKN